MFCAFSIRNDFQVSSYRCPDGILRSHSPSSRCSKRIYLAAVTTILAVFTWHLLRMKNRSTYWSTCCHVL